MVEPLVVAFVPESGAGVDCFSVVEIQARQSGAIVSRAIRCEFFGLGAEGDCQQAARDLNRSQISLDRIFSAWYRHPNRQRVAIVRGENRP